MSGDNKVELSVTSDLRKIIADLEALQKKATGVTDNVKRVGDELDKNLSKAGKKTEQNFERLRDLGRRLANQLRGYFSDIAAQTAASLEGVKKNLGLKQQFIDATKGAVELYDVIRKVSSVLGVSNERMALFQKHATQAMAGFSQGDIAKTLEGLSRTQVRGEGNILAYGATASNLAQAGGDQVAAGAIAKALADVLTARGINPNNIGEMSKVADDARKAMNATGKHPLETLSQWSGLYSEMSDDSRKKIGSKALRNMSAVEAVIDEDGSGKISSLMKALTAGRLKRLPQEMQGLGGLIDANGLNVDKLQKIKGIGGRIGFDKQASWETTGLPPDAAAGMVRLLEQLPRVIAAQNAANAQGGTIEEQASNSRGLNENASTIKNRVTGVLGGELIAPMADAANKVLNKASKTNTGSALALGGGFLAASAGAFALSKLSKLGGAASLPESIAKSKVLEQITGEKTIPVFVVNLGELSGLGGPMAGGGASGVAGYIAPVVGAIGAGITGGEMLYEASKKGGLAKTVKDAVTNDAVVFLLGELIAAVKGGGKSSSSTKQATEAATANELERQRQAHEKQKPLKQKTRGQQP